MFCIIYEAQFEALSKCYPNWTEWNIHGAAMDATNHAVKILKKNGELPIHINQFGEFFC